MGRQTRRTQGRRGGVRVKRRPTVTAAIMMSAAQRERILRAERRGKPALGCVVGSSQAENEGVGVSLGVAPASVTCGEYGEEGQKMSGAGEGAGRGEEGGKKERDRARQPWCQSVFLRQGERAEAKRTMKTRQGQPQRTQKTSEGEVRRGATYNGSSAALVYPIMGGRAAGGLPRVRLEKVFHNADLDREVKRPR
eukprot:2136330-Rhodomonas_salina.1